MYIYKTTNLINNKIYIGLSTKTVEESTNYYGSGVILNRSIDKNGKDNFKKEILENNIDDVDLLYEREIYWIAYYNSTNHSIGYNIGSGGGGGNNIANHPDRDAIVAKISKKSIERWKDPEYKAMMSNKRRELWTDPEYKTKMSKAFKGHPAFPNQQRATAIANANRVWTEESRDKLRKTQTGKKFSKEVNMKKGRPGSKWYHNPDTGETTMSVEVLSAPWVKGRGKLK
jgi:hypothetical protein